MKFIAISFTLKDQPFDQIKKVLEILSKQIGTACLVHGFMPREAVIEKGFSTEVVDTLKELFPIQMNCYDGGPQRDLMASVIKQTYGEVYAIGEIKEGVAEEVELYKKQKISIATLPLNWVGDMVGGRPKTEGEYRVRIDFNASGSSLVNDIKKAGARFIDQVNEMELGKDLNPRDAQSFGRLKSLAMTGIEQATSDAVKAATV